MRRYVVDTNVPIVANGRADPGNPPSIDCREAAVGFLLRALTSATILVDLAGEIQTEYGRRLRPSGQPGVGDRFYQEVLRGAPRRVQRVDLPKRDDGEYVDCPQALIDDGFDRSDRKFAALARRGRTTVVNATDSDWLDHRAALHGNGIRVDFICGCDRTRWFTR